MFPFDEIEIKELQCSTAQKRYLVCQGSNYLEANQMMVELLTCLKKSETIEEASKMYVETTGSAYTVEKIAEYVNTTIAPRFSTADTAKNRRKFLYQVELLKAETVNRITRLTGFMFRKPLLISITIIAAVLDFLFLAYTPNLLSYTGGSNIYIVLGLFVCVCLSSFFHELGHASACSYYGVKHGGIGIGLYLTFPVLYTDVNNAWRLSRGMRCVVNFAGVYFQCIIAILLIAIFYFTELPFLKYLLLMMNMGFAFVLNPFFKFDGYWLASDLLGVPNLRKRSNEVVVYCIRRLLRRPTPKPYIFSLKKWIMMVFAVYTLFTTAFMGYFFLYVLPLFVYNFVQTFPHDIERMSMYLSAGVEMPFSLLRNIVSQGLFMAFIVIMIASPVYKKIANGRSDKK